MIFPSAEKNFKKNSWNFRGFLFKIGFFVQTLNKQELAEKKLYHYNSNLKKLEDILEPLENDNVFMFCDNCGTKKILPFQCHAMKLGCKCKNDHQRWVVDIDKSLGIT